jgi:hypothetical protein
MDVEFQSVRDPGDKDHERVVLSAEKGVDLGRYMLIAARVSGKSTTLGGRVPASYWFPDRDINAGDLVVVYTKAGSSTAKENSSGKTSHFFYWGKTRPIWDRDDVRPVLLRVSVWKSYAGAEASSAADDRD